MGKMDVARRYDSFFCCNSFFTWYYFTGDGILFNIVHNRSNEFGTQPFFWYFYSVLPRMLLSSTIFALVPSFYKNKYAFVGLLFVLIYSILPHKELRFVIYVLPLMNLCASIVIVKLLQFCCKLSQESDSDKVIILMCFQFVFVYWNFFLVETKQK